MPRRSRPEDIAAARVMRADGVPPEVIAGTLGYSIPWTYAWTKGYAKSTATPKPTVITKTVVRYVEPKWTPPKQSALRQRLLRLAQRGFDVPPSKQADWDTLARSGVTVAERVKMLGLE